MGVRVAIDIGGTFTDLIAIDEATQEAVTTKAPSTPDNPAEGFIHALRKADIDPASITDVIHGTTVGTNAVIERKGAKVGLLCTEGFRDILETRRLWREHLFGNWWERPTALIPRKVRRGVKERMDYTGQVVIPLDEDDAREAIWYLKEQGVTSYAVAFLHSYANPAHELRVKEIIGEIHPEAAVTLSSEVLPEIREYERTSTTVISAMLKPVISTYLRDVERRLKDLGTSAPIRVMKSNGGLMTAEAAGERAVETFNSGPAGGVSAALSIGQLMGARNIITFDMGGTSTDVSLIYNYLPLYTNENDIEWNIPVRTPMLDIRSIGAGGGSIAWIDRGGVLQVGPQSAGAVPGPVCYGRGGENPTVTDANLVLQRIDPEYFLGGQMRLNYDRAEQVIADRIAARFGWTTVEAAHAIYRISQSNMSLLIREMTINRGYDPRDFMLMSFGGAGALFAGDIAEELGIPRVCIPVTAGVFSALGGLLSDIIYDYVQSHYCPVEELRLEDLTAICKRLKERAVQQLAQDNIRAASRLEYQLDLRYIGESFELTVPFAFNDGAGMEELNTAVRVFHQKHSQLYGFDRPVEPVELVNVRLRTVAHRTKPRLRRIREDGNVLRAMKGQRDVYFHQCNGFVRVPVYQRDLLGYTAAVEGPAVIEEPETTIIVFPGHRATVDPYGNIVMEVR